MNAGELLLHIGHEKTGTTTLQGYFTHNRVALQKQAILFPQVGRSNGNATLLAHHLFNDQTDTPIRRMLLGMALQDARRTSAQTWDRICDTVAKSGPDTLLISSEHFFRNWSDTALSRLNRETRAVAQRRKIIAYIRAPHHFLLSDTQQNLKHVRPRLQIRRTYAKDTITPLMQHWQGDLSLNVFDRSCMTDGDIVADFLVKNLPALDWNLLQHPDADKNTTMSAEAIAVLLDIREGRLPRGDDYATLISEVIRADRKIPDPTKARLYPAAAQTFINWRAPDLFWLRDRHGLKFPDIDYDRIDADMIDKSLLHFDAAEQICTVDPNRKAQVYQSARRRAALPRLLRRWLAKH